MKKLKALLVSMTALCLLAGNLQITEQILPEMSFISASAEDVAISGTCGENLTWNFNEDTGILTISGTGAMDHWNLASVSSDGTPILPNMPPWYEYHAIIKEIMIENGVTTIGDIAFMMCTLESITIPESVTAIGKQAFYGCSGLKSITIPNSVETIGNQTFFNCSRLESIEVSENNQNYSSQDGVLFNKEKTVLLQFPPKISTEYTIPDGVITIGSEAFRYCSALTTVTIPDSLTTIGYSAFGWCRALKAVTIPASVTTIENDVFLSCSALKAITIENPECEIGDNASTISDTATIYGYPGSTAQAYAEKYDRKFVALEENPVNSEILWGDANHDGTVDISDVVLMNRVYVGVDQVSAEGMKNADVDQSGKIELSDSMNVLKLLVHLLEQFDFPIQAES